MTLVMMAQEEIRSSIRFSWAVTCVLQFAVYWAEEVILGTVSVVRVFDVTDKSFMFSP